jgi:hypothetical protein
MRALCLIFVAALIGCGDGSSSGAGFAGTYNATYSGTWQNTTPNTLSGANTATGTVSVTDSGPNEVTMVWTLPPNPPSGSIVFVLNNGSGTVKPGTAVGGSCFSGVINGNQQTNCCVNCSVVFSGKTFTQPNAGNYTGTTPQGISYTGTYTGTWTGTRP